MHILPLVSETLPCMLHVLLFVTECADGTFGVDCEWVCNCRLASEVCNKSTGECASGCQPGFAGLGCQIRMLIFSIPQFAGWYACK